jgi:hypothetical protein
MYRISLLLFLVLLIPSISHADGMVVDKVYHPYVLPNEQEFEWRVASHDNDGEYQLRQRLGYGHSLSETVSIEAYLIGERYEDSFQLSGYELEARWMLTEQGEYWADWGTLFEVEKSSLIEAWEASLGLIMEKEFDDFSLTLNAFTIYEWGEDVDNEFETEVRAQYRYRWKPEFQPSIELYFGENYRGLGPGFTGVKRFDAQKQLKWDTGIIFEVGDSEQNFTIRMAVEYEF